MYAIWEMIHALIANVLALTLNHHAASVTVMGLLMQHVPLAHNAFLPYAIKQLDVPL